jgi:hypothetical protein
MPVKPIRQRYVDQVKLDVNGAGSIEFTMKADFLLTQTTWKVTGVNGVKPIKQATAINTINGEDWEGTYSGNQDSSGSTHLLITSDVLRCEWTGGDANATAQLTLRGIEYPAGTGMDLYQSGGGAGGPPVAGSAGPSNPILGGNTLIRDAIQSRNFQAGVAGWQIATTGNAEFNSAVIRGTLSADNGNVLVNDTGLTVVGTQQKIQILDGGLYVTGIPDLGAFLQLAAAAGFGATILMQPETSTVPGLVFTPAEIFVDSIESLATNSQPKLQLISPFVNGSPNKASAQIVLFGQTNTSGTDNSRVQIDAGSMTLGTTKFSRPNATVSFTKSIPTGVVTQIDNTAFTVVRDSYGLYNNGLFVTDRAGIWEVGVFARYQSQAAVVGQRQIRCQLNGVDFQYMALGPTTALNGTLIPIQMIWRDQLGAGTQIGFQGFQNSGGALTLGNDARAWISLIEDI